MADIKTSELTETSTLNSTDLAYISVDVGGGSFESRKITVENFKGSTGSGVLLTEVDMTNSGANDLNNIDITWLSAWDNFDYVKILINGCEVGNNGQIGFALSSDGGTTWVELINSGNEALNPTNDIVGAGDQFNLDARLNILGKLKSMFFDSFDISSTNVMTFARDAQKGYDSTYNGTLFASFDSNTYWTGWDTGSSGLDGYMLRFSHEVGNFTSGILKVVGYKNP